MVNSKPIRPDLSYSHVNKEANDYEDENYPFRNAFFKNLTFLSALQIVVMSLTVAPIRLILVLGTFCILWPFTKILTSGQTEANRHEPIKGWRKNLRPVIKFLCRCEFLFTGVMRIRRVGEEHLDENAPVVVLAPHTGFMDALFFVYANFLSSIVHAGSEELPFFGSVCKCFKPIVVNREKSTSRSDTVQRIVERVKRAEESRASGHEHALPVLGVFPQATSTNQKSLIRFKIGAFVLGKPIQPVCLRYPNLRFDSVSWTWEGPGHWLLIWLNFCQFNVPVEYHILPAYYPNEEEKENPELFAENVRKLMADYLKIPLSDLSYEDAHLISKMVQYKLPKKCALIRVHHVKKKFKSENLFLDFIYI